MCNSNSGRTICLASCNYYNISYPIRQHPFSWKACKTFSLFFVHHAHYLTKTIFIFRHSIKFRLYIAPLCQGRLIMPSLKGKGDRRQAVVEFPTEIFFLHVSVLCQRQHFHSQKAPPPPFPAARALHKYFLLEPVFTRNICGFSSIILL